jgi:uncharacterized zinc-type alcohol dehydrogenase-like protein
MFVAGTTTYSPLRHWKVEKGTNSSFRFRRFSHMAVKFEPLLLSRSYRIKYLLKKEADAKKLGAHKFILDKDAEQLKSAAGY